MLSTRTLVSVLCLSTLVAADALDANHNGISDVWESQYPAAAATPFADGDGDGCLNRAEGLACTDPTDDASFFKPVNFATGGGTDRFHWPGERWTRDRVMETTDLVDWTRQGDAVQSDGTERTMEQATAGPRRFYGIARSYLLNSDTDALTNKEEELLGTDPEKWDSDGDKVADDIEFLNGTDPLVTTDSDGDGIADDYERWCIVFDAGDGVTDLAHVGPGLDFDNDSVDDEVEFGLGTSPVQPLRNILFFITEDQSVHLGLYDTNPADGYAGDSATAANNRTRGLDTPHLDTLGGSGVVFDKAFCMSPVCSPSKMALYTGTFPHTNSAHRNVGNYGTNFPLPAGSDPSNLGLGGVHEDLPTFIEIFRDRGWFTAVSSKTHVEPIRKYPYHEGYGNLGTSAVAAAAMDDVITRAGDQPFFFWANLGSPHLPFRSVPNANGVWSGTGGLVGDGHVTNVDANAVDVPDCYPDVPAVRQDIADYYGAIEVIDSIFQACVDKLVERGVDGETVIFFTSDHGIGLHRAKQSVYSTGMQIPLLVSGPGVRSGHRTHEPVSHLDLAPTFLDLIGMPQMPSHLGKSLWPILGGTQDDFPDRDTMLTSCHRYYTGRAVCDGRYYYVRNLSQPSGGTLAVPNPVLNQDQYQPGSPWYNRSYDATVAATGTPQRELLRQIVEGDLPSEELFDLDADLWCTNNLVDNPALAGVKARLRGELARWRIATEDYNTSASEMTRRSQRYLSPDPPTEIGTLGGIVRGDDFDGKTGLLNDDPDWASIVGPDFNLGSDQLDGPAAPVAMAEYGLNPLPSGAAFQVSVRAGFSGQGVGAGVAFGIDGTSGWQFMLADGRSSPGGFDKDVRLYRVDNGSQSAPALLVVNDLENYPTSGFADGDLFTVRVTGQEGSSLVDLHILDPGGGLYYENLTFDLGQVVPANSGFGVTTWSSNSAKLDNFSVTIGGPITAGFDFESTGVLNDHPDWTTAIFGNSGEDFSFVADPLGGADQALGAPPGNQPPTAFYEPLVLGTNQQFTATMELGYETSGIYGGLVFGFTDADNWFSFELGNGNTNNGVVLNKLFRIRKNVGGGFSTVLELGTPAVPIIQEGRWYQVRVSGQAGSSSIDYAIVDTTDSSILTSGTVDLGLPVPAGSRFGLTAFASWRTRYDHLEVTFQ